ncbi:MAG: hypothetical protein K0Q65_387 [Clostridia bacterium]|jgi:hypothetical protein|nr:hypothetical protein [Clostridia bacterium]
MLITFKIAFSNLIGFISGERIISSTASQMQLLEEVSIYHWILTLLVLVLVMVGIFVPKIYRYIPESIYRSFTALAALIVGFVMRRRPQDDTPDNEDDLYEAIEAAGYSYEPEQDIFFSNMDAWQRNMGYCRLYDEAAAPMGMIIDCEPIYFEYDGKRWMIEFWKGQYDLTTGCEIGVYATEEPDINIPNVFNGTFYSCAGDEDLLHMAYLVKKNDEEYFAREGKHWWLTGFKLGEFSEPSELTMDLTITLKDEMMRDAFVEGLRNAGYIEEEIHISENTVELKFDMPHTPQPSTRVEETDSLIQLKNQLLCEQYQEITAPYQTFPDKIKAIQEKAPELFEKIMNMGKTKLLFSIYEDIKDYLDE